MQTNSDAELPAFLAKSQPTAFQQQQTEECGSDTKEPQPEVELSEQVELGRKIKKNFLVFRPYEDPMTIRPYLPKDNGYFFYLHNCDIKIIRYTMEDNGFRDVKTQRENYKNNDGTWTLFWSVGPIKKAIYESLMKY